MYLLLVLVLNILDVASNVVVGANEITGFGLNGISWFLIGLIVIAIFD